MRRGRAGRRVGITICWRSWLWVVMHMAMMGEVATRIGPGHDYRGHDKDADRGPKGGPEMDQNIGAGGNLLVEIVGRPHARPFMEEKSEHEDQLIECASACWNSKTCAWKEEETRVRSSKEGPYRQVEGIEPETRTA